MPQELIYGLVTLAAVVGIVVAYLIHHGSITKVVKATEDVAKKAVDGAKKEIHQAVGNVVAVTVEAKNAVEGKKDVKPTSGQGSGPVAAAPVVPAGAVVQAPADKRKSALEEAHAAYTEAKTQLGADHPDVKEASRQVMQLAVAHAQKTFSEA